MQLEDIDIIAVFEISRRTIHLRFGCKQNKLGMQFEDIDFIRAFEISNRTMCIKSLVHCSALIASSCAARARCIGVSHRLLVFDLSVCIEM